MDKISLLALGLLACGSPPPVDSLNEALCQGIDSWAPLAPPWLDFDLVPVHGFAADGEAVNPVWGAQAAGCGTGAADWLPCAPDPSRLCAAAQNGPILDFSTQCAVRSGQPICVGVCDFHPIERVDFLNRVVYDGHVKWLEKSNEGFDDDYTMNLFSPRHELVKGLDHHVHLEYDADEVIDRITDCPHLDWNCGSDHNLQAAQSWWQLLRDHVDAGDDVATECFLKSQVTPNFDLATCYAKVKADGFYGADENPIYGNDPIMRVMGVPGMDCCHTGPSEIHPVLGAAIQISSVGPQKWAFFYRNFGNHGECSNIESVLSLGTHAFEVPIVAPQGQVPTSATVHIDWMWWEMNDFTPGIGVQAAFDPAKKDVKVSVTLPDPHEGVAGVITVTPHFCHPKNCGARGTRCGIVPDGCGGTLICNSCPDGQECLPDHTCCRPTTCKKEGKNCGTISDGCVGTLHCGTCTLPEICGNGSEPNVCSPGECDPVCAPGQLCIKNSEFTWGCCTPRACGQPGSECGAVSDGCGNTIQCGRCDFGRICLNGICVPQS